MLALIEDVIGHLGAAQVQGIPSDEQIVAKHIDEALTAAKALRDTPTAEEITWLQAMLSDAVELLETAQSGFIPGCGADTHWTDRCDKTLERYRARNKQ